MEFMQFKILAIAPHQIANKNEHKDAGENPVTGSDIFHKTKSFAK